MWREPGKGALKDADSGLEAMGQRDKGEPFQEREESKQIQLETINQVLQLLSSQHYLFLPQRKVACTSNKRPIASPVLLTHHPLFPLTNLSQLVLFL